MKKKPMKDASELSPETRAAVERGLAESARGETVNLGSFAQFAREIGRRGGLAKSTRKAKASRKNGKKGGRPEKT
tara:strand:- start:117 stop:341 length:225 start_codon:yes stop_codon:yes gene_type:complete